MQTLIIFLFIGCVDLLSARPAEGPTKFVLNTTENNANNVSSSRLEEAKELLRRISDTFRHGRGRLVNSILLARNIIVDRAEQKLTNEVPGAAIIKRSISNKSSQNRRSVLLEKITPTVPSTDNLIRLENEREQGLFEGPLIPTYINEGLYNALTPKPLVDRIREEEKYGNTGKFDGIERAFVNGYTDFSQGLVALLDVIPLTEPKRSTARDNFFKQNLNRIKSAIDNLAKTKLFGY